MARHVAYLILHDRDALLALAEEHGYSPFAMATTIGCSHQSINHALTAHGLVNPNHKPRRHRAELRDRFWLHQRYWEDGRSIARIAAELGCSRWPVREALRKFGIPRRPERMKPRVSGAPLLNDPDWLRARIADGWTVAQIEAHVGRSATTVYVTLRRFGIATPNTARWQPCKRQH